MQVKLSLGLLIVLFGVQIIISEGYKKYPVKLIKTLNKRLIHELSYGSNTTSYIKRKVGQQGVVFQNEGILKEHDSKASVRTDPGTGQYSAMLRSDNAHRHHKGDEISNETEEHLQCQLEISEPTANEVSYKHTPPICGKRPVINVAVIDLGFELNHPNLNGSTNASLSFNFFSRRRNVLPAMYGYDMKNSYPGRIYDDLSHGTKIMGRIGANAGNGCDQGVAPHVKLVDRFPSLAKKAYAAP